MLLLKACVSTRGKNWNIDGSKLVTETYKTYAHIKLHMELALFRNYKIIYKPTLTYFKYVKNIEHT